jgi:hypothetical protein
MVDSFAFFLDFIKYLLPALVIFLVVYYQQKAFFDDKYQKRMIDLRREQDKTILPLKLQAYERMILFIERISPESLVMRIHQPGISASQLKIDLIASINQEFNHNISQQLYVSSQCWQMIRIVKEEMINLINTAYSNLGPNCVGIDLSKVVFEEIIKMNDTPTHKALVFVKKEFDLIF